MIDRTYFRFLAHSGPINLGVDRVAVALLDEIALCDVEPLTVTEAMSLAAVASPATIHRKLDVLREIGMIDTFFEGKNRRTKYLCPTPQAEKYFSQVGDVMHQAGMKTA